MSLPKPLERMTFDTAKLIAGYPPLLRHPNKRVVFDIACGADDDCAGEIGYSRWPAFRLPGRVDPIAGLAVLEGRCGIMDYEPLRDLQGAIEWHVNFADPMLFFAYGSGLFAQDEMQCAEHPALGSLVEALRADGHRSVTETADGPTPVLITGVQRRCRVATNMNAAEGRPRGLYGNEFAVASADAVARATTRIDPPTITNLIAMAAPTYRSGRYERAMIERILVTAFTGFAAAVAESALLAPGAPVVVHTGFWGCGAFGGNRTLMSTLQLIAAGMAGLARLVFHTASAEGTSLSDAEQIIREQLGRDGEMSTQELIDRIDAMAFEWGRSEGT
ncbi:MAG: poly(ADP-ribose) glycohydrolase [Coriobacteriia bacterium]